MDTNPKTQQSQHDSINYDDNYNQEEFLNNQKSQKNGEKIQKISIMNDFNQLCQKLNYNHGEKEGDQSGLKEEDGSSLLSQYYTKIKQTIKAENGEGKEIKKEQDKKSKIQLNGGKAISPGIISNNRLSPLNTNHAPYAHHNRSISDNHSLINQPNLNQFQSVQNSKLSSSSILTRGQNQKQKLQVHSQQFINQNNFTGKNLGVTFNNNVNTPGNNQNKKPIQMSVGQVLQQNKQRNYSSVEDKKKILQPSKNNVAYQQNFQSNFAKNYLNLNLGNINGQSNSTQYHSSGANLNDNLQTYMSQGGQVKNYSHNNPQHVTMKDYFGEEENNFVSRKVHGKNFISSSNQSKNHQKTMAINKQPHNMKKALGSNQNIPYYQGTNPQNQNSKVIRNQNNMKQMNVQVKNLQRGSVNDKYKNQKQKTLSQNQPLLKVSKIPFQKPQIRLYKRTINLGLPTKTIIEKYNKQKVSSQYDLNLSQSQSTIQQGLFAKAIDNQRTKTTVQNVQSTSPINTNVYTTSMIPNYKQPNNQIPHSKYNISSPMSINLSPNIVNSHNNANFQKRQNHCR